MGAEPRRKLEFAVLTVAIGVLGGFLLTALEDARRDVEESAVQGEAAALRVELLDRVAHRETWGGDLPASRNPVRWTGRAPADYLGELDSPPDAAGVWYFNRSTGVLAYRYRRGGEARFRLAVGVEGSGTQGVLAGVGLIRLENVR